MKKSLATIFLTLLLSGYAWTQDHRSKWQVKASYDYMTHGDVYSLQSDISINNSEKNTFYIAVTRLSPLKGRIAFRYGLSFSDKGYLQDFSFNNPNSEQIWKWQIQRQLFYFLSIP